MTFARVCHARWLYKICIFIVTSALLILLFVMYWPSADMAEELRGLHLKNNHWTAVDLSINDAFPPDSTPQVGQATLKETMRELNLAIHESVKNSRENLGIHLMELSVEEPVRLYPKVSVADSQDDPGVFVSRIRISYASDLTSPMIAIRTRIQAAISPWPLEVRHCNYTFSKTTQLQCVFDVYHTNTMAGVTTNENEPQQRIEHASAVVATPPPKTKRYESRSKRRYRLTGLVLGADTQLFIDGLPVEKHPEIESAELFDHGKKLRLHLRGGSKLSLVVGPNVQ
ncbi:MAG: hypothetical protein KTR35_14670 [Gammaproteobacteria bacterium]|nr:hypothetical protein [Gammaproteobacteria bacterium]